MFFVDDRLLSRFEMRVKTRVRIVTIEEVYAYVYSAELLALVPIV